MGVEIRPWWIQIGNVYFNASSVLAIRNGPGGIEAMTAGGWVDTGCPRKVEDVSSDVEGSQDEQIDASSECES